MPCPRRGSVSAAAAPPEAQLPQHALDGGEPGVLRAAPRAWSRTGQGGAKASAPDLQPLYQQGEVSRRPLPLPMVRMSD